MSQPTESQYQANDRVTFAVLEAGEGEPLVFIHGAGGLQWDPFLDALSQHYRVIAPFLPGTGNSTGLENIYNLWELLLAYYDLFDALQIDRANLLGHSLGGMIACELAAMDRSRVARLMALAPAGLWRDEEPMADIFAMTPDELLRRITLDPESPVAQAMMALPEDLDEQVEVVIQRIATLQAAAKFLWQIPDKGLRRRLYRIQAPTLILWGRQDGLIPVSYLDDFAAGIPHARTQVLEPASHILQLEQLPACLEAVRACMDAPDQAATA